MTLAGLLLDFVDGDDDYSRRARPANLEVTRAHVFETAPGQRFVSGDITNRDPQPNVNVHVTIEFLDGAQVVHRAQAPADPATLAPNQRGSFLAPAPANLAFQTFRVRGEIIPAKDDDPLQVPLSELLATIEGFQGTKQYSGGRLFDIHDLYLALKKDFGGRARAADGRDAVDAIFIAHGFYADLNGNGRYDGEVDPDQACLSPGDKTQLKAINKRASEEIGLTSHCPKNAHPMIIPRYSPAEPPLEALAAIDTGGVQATALVHITFPAPNEARGYGYYAGLDTQGRLHLAVPPPASGATLTVVMMAPGHLPAIAATIPVDEYWKQAEQNPGRSFLSYRVTLQPGDSSQLAPYTPAPALAPVTIGAAALVGLLGLGGLWRLIARRRRPNA
jgi:hypothetical protein